MHAEPQLAPSATGAELAVSELLTLLPYGSGFLFVDEILEADGSHTVTRYRFRASEFFYTGHFSDLPLTPGVILLEAMCQGGMVAQGLYLLAREIGTAHASRYRFLVTSSEVEWFEQVHPNDRITIRSQLTAWRKRRIRTDVKAFSEEGRLLAAAVISGLGVLWSDNGFRALDQRRATNNLCTDSGGT